MGLVAFVVTALVILRTLPETLSSLSSHTFYSGTTQMAMRRVAQRIQQYQEEHRKLPDTLAEVPLGKDENLDAWKQPLLYERRKPPSVGQPGTFLTMAVFLRSLW